MSDITLNAPKLFDLSGNTALVTGAGSGIGQRIAMGLAQCGADVALLDRRTDDGLAQTADFIARTGRRSIQIAADVTQSAALNDAVARTEAELGALSLAVNSAGIANANPAEEMEEAQFQTMMDINLKGVFLSCQAEARAMLKHGRGSIVNIASMSGVIVNRGLMQCHYNASKAGVIHMSRVAAAQLSPQKIRVNAICPGLIATSIFGASFGLPREVADQMAARVAENAAAAQPVPKAGLPDDIAQAALYLASDAAAFVSGTHIVVDGGITVGGRHSWDPNMVSPFATILGDLTPPAQS